MSNKNQKANKVKYNENEKLLYHEIRTEILNCSHIHYNGIDSPFNISDALLIILELISNSCKDSCKFVQSLQVEKWP